MVARERFRQPNRARQILWFLRLRLHLLLAKPVSSACAAAAARKTLFPFPPGDFPEFSLGVCPQKEKKNENILIKTHPLIWMAPIKIIIIIMTCFIDIKLFLLTNFSLLDSQEN